MRGLAMSINEQNKKWFVVTAIVLVCFAFSPPAAGVETWQEKTKLLASDGAEGDNFGWSVTISDDYAIVGADGKGSTGSAYVFRLDGPTWSQQQNITASDGAKNVFGISISISGKYIIIGAYSDDYKGSDSGSAYIFNVQ